MSRFAALDLTALPDPSAIGVPDFDAILEARLVELEAQLAEVFDASKVVEVMALARNIAASPMRYLNEAAAAAWELYLENRIHEAMRDGAFAPFGPGGGVVEVDETFIGNDRTKKPRVRIHDRNMPTVVTAHAARKAFGHLS